MEDKNNTENTCSEITSELETRRTVPTSPRASLDPDSVITTETSLEKLEPQHKTILQGTSFSLRRCTAKGCCDCRVHCPFCDIRQYKPAQPARVRDHLHLTHFQHAVYYNGAMIVKCFQTCRTNDPKGGHYHCPVCSSTLLKRTAFTKHLYAHAAAEGLERDVVQAPDSKKPSVVYYEGKKIELCRNKCLDTLGPHFHCPLCRRSCDQLSALTSHLWRCKKRAVSVASKINIVDPSGSGAPSEYNVAQLFSPQIVQTVPSMQMLEEYKWHQSIVRNLSDLSMVKCDLTECCKGRYHCPLCTTSKLKPNHLFHMKQHFISHWRSGVRFQDYMVLVCYLPCELSESVNKIRFHYHCPLCGDTRRRKEGFARHLTICDSSPHRDQDDGDNGNMEESDDEEAGSFMELSSFADGATATIAESDKLTNPSGLVTLSRRDSADQAELQVAESLADMDRIVTESMIRTMDPTARPTLPTLSGDQPSGVVSAVELAKENSQNSLTISAQDSKAAVEPVQENNQDLVALSDKDNSQNVNSKVCLDQENNQDLVALSDKDNTQNVKSKVSLDQENSQNLVALSDKNNSQNENSEVNLAQEDSQNLISLYCSATSAQLESVESQASEVRTTSQPQEEHGNKAVKTVNASRSEEENGTTDELGKERPDCADGKAVANNKCSKLNDAVSMHQSEEVGFSSTDKDATSSTLKGANILQSERVEEEISEADFVSKNISSDATESKAKISKDSLDDNVQIFQQVSTQISDSIVSELVKRGDLQQCLQAVGEACRVSWQQTGSTVTMTCHLDQLCQAQHCLKQILKDGLDKFLKSPSAAVSSPPPPTPQVGRKRPGRPPGSKNKAKILKTSNAAHRVQNPQTDTDADSVKLQVPENSSLSDSICKSVGRDCSGRRNSKGVATKTSLEHAPTSVGSQYSGRTRGKRINFAELAEGKPPPVHPDPVEKPVLESSTPHSSVKKRGRGRPRKIQPAESADTKKLTEDSKTSLDETGEKVEEKITIQEKQQENDVNKERAAVELLCRQAGRAQSASDKPEKEVENVSQSSSALVSSSLSSSTYTVADIRRTDLVENGPLPSQSETQNCHSDSLKDVEKEGQKEMDFVIHGRSKMMYQSHRGTTDFAIIPSIFFDRAGDEKSEEEQPISTQDSETDAAEKPSTSFTSDKKQNNKVQLQASLETSHSIQEPMENEGKSNVFICPICELSHSTYALLKSHITSEHPQESAGQVMCDRCEKVVSSHDALCVHLGDRHGHQAHKCRACNKGFASVGSLHWHNLVAHKKPAGQNRGRPRLKCQVCSYVALDSWDMRHHREQHRDQPTSCLVCNKTLSSQAVLKVHMAAKHSGDSVTCHICNKSFAHVRYLRAHLQRHGGEKRHVCPVCGWRFYQTNTLRAHMDTHKPRSQRRYSFKCPLCPAAYNSRANWKDHMNKHSGARPHICGKCGKGFAFRSMLTTHTNFVHSADRPHTCTECDKKYKTKAQLRQHLMTHSMARTGTSPFMCAKCDRPMASKARLQAHAVRCKGGNLGGPYKQILWRQGVASTNGDSKIQVVDLLSAQPVSFEAPLVDLLPGQQINIVHQGFGKDATITLVPVQNEATDGETITTKGLANQLDNLKREAGETFHENSSSIESISTKDINLQQSISIHNSNNLALSDSCSLNFQPVAQTEAVSLTSNNGNVASHQTVTFQDGHTIRLLPNVSFSSSLQTQSLDLGQFKDATPSSSSVIIPQAEMSSSQSQLLVTSGDAVNQSPRSETSGKHQVIVTNSFGQQHTLFLPPDLLKQEVVVIESEDGRQNIIDLSGVQIVQAEDTENQTAAQCQEKDSRISSDRVDTIDVAECQSQEATETMGDSSCLAAIADDGSGEVGSVGGEELSIYMCSSCNQQFDRMDLAEQHVLLEHPTDVSVAYDETMSMDTNN